MGKKIRYLLSLIIGFLIALSSAAISLLIAVDQIIAPDTARTISQLLIEVDGVLVGFFGIILIYSLTSIANMRNTTLNWMHKTTLFISDLEVRKMEKPKLQKAIDASVNTHQKLVSRLQDIIDDLNRTLSHIYVMGVIAIFFFIASILLSILALGKTGTEGLYSVYIHLPLMATLIGTFMIFLVAAITLPPTE